MQMKNDEIVMRYRQARNKGDQVQILAELNNCPVERIIDILTAAGIDNRNFNRLRAKLDKQKTPKEQAHSYTPNISQKEKKKLFDESLAKQRAKTSEIIQEPPEPEPESSEPADKQQETYYCEELFEPIRKEVAALMDKRRSIYAQLCKVDAELAKYVEFFSAEMLQIDTLRKERNDESTENR